MTQRDLNGVVEAWLQDVPSIPPHLLDDVLRQLPPRDADRGIVVPLRARSRRSVARAAESVLVAAAVLVLVVGGWRVLEQAWPNRSAAAPYALLTTTEVAPSVRHVRRDDAGHDLMARSPAHRPDIDRLAVGADGTVWIASTAHGTDNDAHQGSQVWQLGAPGVQSPVDGVPGTVFDLAVAADATVWAVGDSGIASFDGVAWTAHPTTLGSPTIVAAGEGGVWAAFAGPTGSRLATQVDGQWVDHSGDDVIGPLLRRAAITGIAFTPGGLVWVGLNIDGGPGGGLLRFDGRTWQLVRPLGTLGEEASHDVFGLATDPEGNLWAFLDSPFFGTSSDFRLARFDGLGWTSWSYATGFPTDATPWPLERRLLGVGDDSVVWLAREGGGLVAFDGASSERYLPGMRINGLGVAPDGTMWVAAEQGAADTGGLYVIDP